MPQASARGSGGTAGAAADGRWRIWLGLATIYVVWGSTYLAIRIMVETVPAALGAGLRFLLAGIAMYAWLAFRGGRAAVRVGARELASCALVGTLLVAGGNGLVTVAERHVPSGLAALMIASVPLWVVLLRALARERIGRSTFASVVAGFGGVAILLLPSGRPHGASTAGVILLLAAAASWATGSFSSSRLTLPRDPLVSTAVQMLCGGAVMTVAGVIGGEAGHVQLDAFSARSVIAFAYLVFIGSLVAFTAYVWLLQHAPISQVATYAYVNPVIAVVLGWLVLSEHVTGAMIAGAVVIVASVAATVRGESRPEPHATTVAADAKDAPAGADVVPLERRRAEDPVRRRGSRRSA